MLVPFLARLAVFSIAACYAWMAPGTKWFKRYIAAQCVATLSLLDSEQIIGRHTVGYLWVYIVSTSLVLAAGVGLTISAFRSHKARWLAVLAAIGITFAFDVETIGNLQATTQTDWIAIGEASVLLLTGILTGVSAPYQGNEVKPVCLTLSLLWIGLAVFRLCYRVYRFDPMWNVANQVIPCMMVSGAIAWCGVQLRSTPVNSLR